MSIRSENERSCDAADANGDSSASRTPLFVPPPDRPWTGAELALAISTDSPQLPARQQSNSADASKATTTTIFTFPFTLPGGPGIAKLPTLSPPLPRPEAEEAEAEAASRNAERPLCQPQLPPRRGSQAAAAARDGLLQRSSSATHTAAVAEANAVVLPPCSSPGLESQTSFPTMFVSGVTQVGAITVETRSAGDLHGHSLSFVSSDTTIPSDTPLPTLSPQTPYVFAYGESSGSGAAETPTTLTSSGTNKRTNSPSCSPSMRRNNHTHHNSFGMDDLRSPLQDSTPQAPSFADLFVGLEQPRLHRLPRPGGDACGSWHLAGLVNGKNSERKSSNANNKSVSVPSSALGSITSQLFHIVQDRSNPAASSHEEFAEDAAGAHTPNIYRSPQLPHWWRSIVTPSVGVRVCLRPSTPQLEFWWIDRLGSEAYELIQVILQHSLEGMVLRESAESVVVVEFSIPAAYLGNTSFAVWHPPAHATPSPTSAPAASESWKVKQEDGAGEENYFYDYEEEEEEEAATTLEATAMTNTPPSLEANDTAAITSTRPHLATPINNGVPCAPEHSAATGTSSTFTVGHHTERTEPQSTDTSEVPSREALLGLPGLVRADNAHHDAAEPASNTFVVATNTRTLTTTTTVPSTAVAAAAAAATTTNGLTDGPALLTESRPLPRAASATVLESSFHPSGGASLGGETSVPILQQRHADLPGLPRSSSSVDIVNSYSSYSTVDRSSSVVTAGGGHSDPAVMERRFRKEPPLSRILMLTPALNKFQVCSSGEQRAVAEDDEPSAAAATAAGKERQRQPARKTRTQSAPQQRFFATPNPPINLAGKCSATPFLRTPLTPRAQGYSSDQSDDDLDDTSVADSHDSVTEEDTERSGTPPSPGLPRTRRQHGRPPPYELPTTVFVSPTDTSQSLHLRAHPRVQSTDRTGSVNSNESCSRQSRGDAPPHASVTYDEDPSLLHVDPLSKSEDTSTCHDSRESPLRHLSPQASTYYDFFQRSKTYGEWLRTSNTQSRYSSSSHGSSSAAAAGVGGVLAASGSAGEMANLFEGTTPTTASARETDKGGDDDSVLVRLSLPTSVCIPVVIVRLHALRLLHPLLRALTIPYSRPLFAAANAEDDDGMEGALRTAATVSPFTSELVGHTAAADYHTAVQVINDAISREEEKLTTAAPSVDDVTAKAVPTKIPSGLSGVAPPPLQPRDLSILYTIRSHLFFHMSPDYLHDSLRDAEAALSCCPTPEHVCNTYEILAACLISFGHTAQVGRLAAHLRHRCRPPTPLLTRLGRVTQVMVSYGTLFLHQQLNPTLLRHNLLGRGGSGGTPEHSKNPQSFLYNEGVDSTPLDDPAYLSRGSYPAGGAAAAAAAAAGTNPNSGAAEATYANRSLHMSSPTSMPLVVVGGGIVDPPVGWGRHSSTSRHASGAKGAGPSTSLVQRTLPYEVCPLLLGYYGKSLHRPSVISEHPYPLPLPLSPRVAERSSSPSNGAAVTMVPAKDRDGISAHNTSNNAHGRRRLQHRRFSSRPSNDVCHRRLFLLETLFPSVLPQRAESGTPQDNPLPRSSIYRGFITSRCFQNMRRSLSKGDVDVFVDAGNSAGKSAAAKREKRIKPEDFMYDRDSVLALLASTIDTAIPYGTVSMRYFNRHIRLSATRRILKGDPVLLERPALLLALWPLPYGRGGRLVRAGSSSSLASASYPQGGEGPGGEDATTVPGSSAGTSQRTVQPAYCMQCGRQRLTRLIHCPGKCGSTYCSEACRREALRLYHVVECGGLAEPLPVTAAAADASDGGGDDDAARVQCAVASLQDIFAEWDNFLYRFANWDTPSMRSTTPAAYCTPSVSVVTSPKECGLEPFPRRPPNQQSAPPKPGSHGSADGNPPVTKRRPPPPILAVTAQRAMSRLVAMVLCMVLPVERLPHLRADNEALMKEWAEERHATVRAVAQTLCSRGLMVPASPHVSRTNSYCTSVDPQRLLLLEVMLQQLSVPFFADFTYRAPATVWEAVNEFPCAVPRKATPTGRNNVSVSGNYSGGGGPFDGANFNGLPPNATRNSSIFPLPSRAAPASKPPAKPGQRHWVVELTTQQLEELICTTHLMLQRIHDVVSTALEGVYVLPRNTPRQKSDGEAMAGAPLHWTCTELLAFLPSIRVFEELLDFCLTSCAVVYPESAEPDGGTGVNSSSSSLPTPNSHSWTNTQSAMLSLGGAKSGDSASSSDSTEKRPSEAAPPVVPMAVIGPWTSLTVDLYPIVGHSGWGVIYSRFTVEHEQQRRMIAYCAAAATRRGGAGGGNLGASGYGSGVEDDSFLSIHSIASASAAAVLNGSVLSPGAEDLGRSTPFRDDWSNQMLEDAASRSCANLQLSLVHSLPSSDVGRPPTVAIVMTATKNIQLGDVLWWESLNIGEYLHSIF
ncbi:hypothetical protein ABB37_08394 [Leptomonas pyrrhocoris]|uniref:MYND-type domain-containing protein n=1 Tax=Leptomonas pyrrhocoris TaxID=157538 RepID=A0A0M9FTE3_LEPPY|nr:hypothetical protein ABB37_08394 [Leptomonas pyrrhocoris]XP_015653936.1 hypothetical protein ABB37_08394 [Leptomonas pyrrhocoris]KPA75496.1 hypothetical protein ABB37_08394 [Leptomonas pyrrhocoris]KPA75497.1 hypothetical protein ABB37_08394 [Leptomonas pyrrhocoris]|eukprot:XP_015653935.1 hypothetical protein ABB37_08394 [Leptomonas pyrrhocoris]